VKVITGKADCRLLVYASDEAEDGRYFNKALGELDHVSFVRDRIGQNESDRNDLEEVEERNGEEYDSDVEDQQSTPKKTGQQLDLEEEWGLHRPMTEPRQALHDSDQSGAESERKITAIEEDEEEQEVSSCLG